MKMQSMDGLRCLSLAALLALAPAAGAQQAGVPASAAAPAVDTAGLAAAEAANKAQALEARRVSPKERAELAKAELGQKNLQSAGNFLTNNRSMRGVSNLPDGLQYRILQAGHGKHPGDADTVRCRYVGMLTDGSTFDRSDGTTPAVLRVAGLLPGLREAVKLMPAGSKWEVVLPPQLGYGARGNGPVAPNAVLIYTLELVGVN